MLGNHVNILTSLQTPLVHWCALMASVLLGDIHAVSTVTLSQMASDWSVETPCRWLPCLSKSIFLFFQSLVQHLY